MGPFHGGESFPKQLWKDHEKSFFLASESKISQTKSIEKYQKPSKALLRWLCFLCSGPGDLSQRFIQHERGLVKHHGKYSSDTTRSKSRGVQFFSAFWVVNLSISFKKKNRSVAISEDLRCSAESFWGGALSLPLGQNQWWHDCWCFGHLQAVKDLAVY